MLEAEVRRAVRAALRAGAASFHEVLCSCEGASPRVVRPLYEQLTGANVPTEIGALTRLPTSEFTGRLPAADPHVSQWWFTARTAEILAGRLFQSAIAPDEVAFIGAPTVAFFYARRYGRAVLYDVDRDVVRALTEDRLVGRHFDVADALPEEYIGTAAAVLVDPPWYPDDIQQFLARALDLAVAGTSVFCSLPPRFTRPTVVEERQALLAQLRQANVEVVSIEPSAVQYGVPDFELAAYRSVPGFDGRPWRSGDILHIKKTASSTMPSPAVDRVQHTRFARDPKRFRFFMNDGGERPEATEWLVECPEFRQSTSRRDADTSVFHWWTSSRRGGWLRKRSTVVRAVEYWQRGDSRERVKELLRETGEDPILANQLVQELDEKVGLWNEYGGHSLRRSPDTSQESALAPYATVQASWLTPAGRDGVRHPFQRDRDRIIWSRGLRQLANKTQLFPPSNDDFLRTRLSHSLEVAQLASTVAVAFGLEPHLVEAGAMAHDVGHTPFGHAGENAINSLFTAIHEKLGGFSHYEHGVDVVRWLEDAYQSPALGQLHGLNLTKEVAECIFKHTFCHAGEGLSTVALHASSKNRDYFDASYCHVEGQAVRIADKVSYLISDLEDGIRVGAIGVHDIQKVALLRRGPLDWDLAVGETLHERFLAQRSVLIGILMNDILEGTDSLLARHPTVAAVRSAGKYVVDHTPGMASEVDEVWRELQVGRLHASASVKLANLHAERIVRELILTYALEPGLVDRRFRAGHERVWRSAYLEHYRGRVGTSVEVRADLLRAHTSLPLLEARARGGAVPTEHIVLAKDFVASLSDSRAIELHRALATPGR